jgi:hypothetical protein
LPSATYRNVSVLFEFPLPSFAGDCRTAAKSRESAGKRRAIRPVTVPRSHKTARVGNPDAFLFAAGVMGLFEFEKTER